MAHDQLAEAFWQVKQKIVKICGKTFVDEVKSVKTMKVFPLKSFAVYGTSQTKLPLARINYALGRITNCSSLTDPIHQAALEKVTKSKTLGRFSRVVIHGHTIHLLEHTRPKKKNIHTVAYNYDSKQYHGSLPYYITDFKQVYAMVVPFVRPLSVFPTDDITFCSVPHIHVYNSIHKSVSSHHPYIQY